MLIIGQLVPAVVGEHRGTLDLQADGGAFQEFGIDVRFLVATAARQQEEDGQDRYEDSSHATGS